MENKRRLVKSYTVEELITIARKYATRTDFHKNDRRAFRAANVLGCYDQCITHMIEKQKPKGYWTKERCQIEALKFNGRYEFCKNGSAAYQAAQEEGWLDKICSHMTSDRKKNGYWRDEKIIEREASNYDSRTEFAKLAPGAYGAALEMGILDKICFNMPRIGNAKNKLVYAWEFPDESVYVGLTFSTKSREKHRNNCDTDAVKKYTKETGYVPVYKIKTNLLPVEEAVKKEKEYVEWYKRNGWNVLNRAKPGAIGGNIIIWTKSNIISKARKCASQKEFREQYPSAYGVALENGWLRLCYKHLKQTKKTYRYWTEGKIQSVALKCESRSQFEKEYPSAYEAAVRKQILGKVCRHMKYLKLPNNHWTFSKIKDIIIHCESINDFIKKHRNVYQAARRNTWLKKLYEEMNWA